LVSIGFYLLQLNSICFIWFQLTSISFN